MTDTSLSGRRALVTGAAGNIGHAVALGLARAGANLVLADHPGSADGLEATAATCAEIGNDCHRLLFDVTQSDAVDAALRGAPTCDLVLNNAGYQGSFANLLDVEPDDVQRVLAVNVAGVFAVLQSCGRIMRSAGVAGSIVNTASMAGVGGAPNMTAYSASKAAVIGLTKSAAKDLAPFGIRVNAISPGFIGPGVMWDRQVEQQAAVPSPYYDDDPAVVADQMVGQVPLGRYGSLAEVAEVAMFLLSDASSYMTGTNLEISGGAA